MAEEPKEERGAAGDIGMAVEPKEERGAARDEGGEAFELAWRTLHPLMVQN